MLSGILYSAVLEWDEDQMVFLYGAEMLLFNKVNQNKLDILNAVKVDCIICLWSWIFTERNTSPIRVA